MDLLFVVEVRSGFCVYSQTTGHGVRRELSCFLYNPTHPPICRILVDLIENWSEIVNRLISLFLSFFLLSECDRSLEPGLGTRDVFSITQLSHPHVVSKNGYVTLFLKFLGKSFVKWRKHFSKSLVCNVNVLIWIFFFFFFTNYLFTLIQSYLIH